MPVCSGCAFTKHPSDAAIGQYLCDTSSPSDIPWPVIQESFSLMRPFQGKPSIFPIGSRSSERRVQLKAYLTKSPPLIRQRPIIPPHHHIPKGTLLRLGFSTPPIGMKTLPLSGIRGWRLIMTWNQLPRMFLWSTLLMMTHCLKDIH